MPIDQHTQTWLREAGVSLDSADHGEVDADGLTVALQLDETGRYLYLYCSLGRLPQPLPEGLAREILTASLLGVELGGGHLGLYAADNLLVYSQRLDVSGCGPAGFGSALAVMTEKAGFWLERLGREDGGPARPAAVEPVPFNAFMNGGIMRV